MKDVNNIEHISFDDAPETWDDRCSGDGYERIINEEGERVFKDNGVSVGVGYRPCAKCGKYPTEDGDDACLSNLGKVINACCGHGKNKGYIQFDNGITVRGEFEIEYHHKIPIEYQIRSRQEILEKIEKLESLRKDWEHIEQIEALKWVMRME